jgi:methionine synthase II (cobalamin-independent)
MITRDITIEDLVSSVPESVSYLMQNGIKCLACGEPIWGTLEEAAREKGFSDEEIDRFVSDLTVLSVKGG